MRKSPLLGQKSFTLLELVIVIIVVGVLASIAFPRFSKLIKKTESVEAINSLRIMHQAIQRCLLMKGSTVACGCVPGMLGATWDDLGIDNPGAAPNAKFNYRGQGCNLNPLSEYYYLAAESKAKASDRIWFVYSGPLAPMGVNDCNLNPATGDHIRICGEEAFSDIDF